MPTRDQIRIETDRAAPRPMALWWALRPVTSVLRFMQTGAHPDDEISGLLAALAFRDGINISYACSTRGEGGQNDVGTETGAGLGALRTREMERACDVLGMRMYWHSTHPADTITDFGFSKSGEETLDRWGRTRTLERFVQIIRTERPDIMMPTFLDVPGQHGHHRAMTEAAHAVMDLAADPDFACDLPPWQVKKLYLPAWSGAGQAYDDDLPPPPATLTITGSDREPMTGWTWNRIGQQSRAYHRSQGMGRWQPATDTRDWPLHLATSHVRGPDSALGAGLACSLADLCETPGTGPIAEDLCAAQALIDRTITAFPHFEEVAEHAKAALTLVQRARTSCPASAQNDILHRLDDKALQLGHVIRLAHGVDARACVGADFLDATKQTSVTVEFDAGTCTGATAKTEWPDGWVESDGKLAIAADATPSDPYRSIYDPRAPARPRLAVTIPCGDHAASVAVPFEVEPVGLPPRRITLSPSASILNTAKPNRTVQIALSDLAPVDATVDLEMPDGWSSTRTDTGFDIALPPDVAEGQYHIRAMVNGQPAASVRTIEASHIAPTASAQPAEARIAVCRVAVPDVRVGYIGAGNDRVGEWLPALGADVEDLSNDQLESPASLAQFDTLVIGIFAMRFRPGLADAMPKIHDWVTAGGTLVTLYHRPWDAWDPDTVPPKRLEIGQPSLRWRVTNEAAPVTILADHPSLTSPNPIASEDWDGWVKERGLYFAKDWDTAYTPLLSMADAGEGPLTGSLLVADIGAGRHIHTSLILHHQMEHLVPGAFRLMANFIAKR